MRAPPPPLAATRTPRRNRRTGRPRLPGAAPGARVRADRQDKQNLQSCRITGGSGTGTSPQPSPNRFHDLTARPRGRPTDVQSFIADYGYLAIFLLMLAEAACIPVPSELIMLFGGALAAGAVAGTHLDLAAVIAAGVAGNLAGSCLAYAAGRYGGQAALHRWGRCVYLREHDVDKATGWFTKYGPA